MQSLPTRPDEFWRALDECAVFGGLSQPKALAGYCMASQGREVLKRLIYVISAMPEPALH
jgi:hypothetical protein